MDFSLLRNKIYLFLLAFYNGKKIPSYVQLGECLGITRQTASVKVKELLKQQIINIENDIVFVSNPLNIDIEVLIDYLKTHIDCFDAIELKEILFDRDIPLSRHENGRILNMSSDTIYAKSHGVIYGICVEGKLKYVGTTQHFEERIKQHCQKRSFLTKDNFIILADENNFQLENYLISLLQPEWNINK